MTGIHQTKEYEIFDVCFANRAINQSLVKQIKASILSKNLLHLHPITVNENMEVMDGQHRLEAAKELGVPIYYQMEKGLEEKDIILINANQKNWSMMDYFSYWGLQRKYAYTQIVNLHNELNLSLNILTKVLCKKSNNKTTWHTYITEGKLEFFDDIEERIADLRAILEMINRLHLSMLPPLPWIRSPYHLRALFSLKREHGDQFSLEEMENQYKICASKISRKSSIRDYKFQAIKVYNYHKKTNKISVSDLDE